jgi:3-methyl-2-oxobutanoate hydroxymethyltransferase
MNQSALSRYDAAAEILAEQARDLEEAGCFSLVLECAPSETARKLTDLLKIPTIGIGAGPNADRQVLVYQGVLGLNTGFKPKFLGIYATTFEVIQAALDAYDRDVKDGDFPSENESYELLPANLPIAKHSA